MIGDPSGQHAVRRAREVGTMPGPLSRRRSFSIVRTEIATTRMVRPLGAAA
jgi:hypothetical protein